MSASQNDNAPLHVAIVGGGITGVALAIGLQARGVAFTLYERAPGLREIGAGIGLSANAERALRLLSPALHAAYKRVANPNGEDYFQWLDGHGTDALLFRLPFGRDEFQGCLRAELLEAMVTMIPAERMRLGKEVRDVSEDADGMVTMRFRDGTTERADAVIGCDGIHSRVRQLLLGEHHPAARASYTHRFCFRALAPMDRAVAALGAYRASTRFMYNGPGAHIITYPVGMGTSLNVLAVISDPGPWTAPRIIAPGTRDEAVRAFADWQPAARAIVGLLPERIDKWALFDMAENPAPGYARGSVTLAGDAAHATAPHLGAGAGLGVEDALALAELLAAVQAQQNRAGQDSSNSGGGSNTKAELVHDALAVFSDVRYRRTQSIVQSTRAACDLFQWRDSGGCGRDPDRFGKEITAHFHAIWDYDIEGMVRKALDEFAVRISESAFL